jgi:ectoine hydroxylase-related dioxygenase (phytanoyl-CoA dioxygenase family)
MDGPAIKKAPAGFTPEQWRVFRRDGLIHLERAIEPDQLAKYRAAAKKCTAGMQYDPAHTNKVENIIAEHDDFRDVIDHDRHAGFPYDIFGDQMRLSQNAIFVRPPGGVTNQWHVDGPRALPYRAFSSVLPLKLRIGYWLTDLPHENMGNMVYLPGSHDGEYSVEHDGIADVPGQRVLTCSAGSITIFHASLWHRIQANESDRIRLNVFLSYTPSWVNGYYFQNEEWASGLSREQRIIVRPYGRDQEGFIRPPAADLPLFYDPDGPEPGPDVEPHKVRRPTRYERYLKQIA